jgi:hypothetical protein
MFKYLIRPTIGLGLVMILLGLETASRAGPPIYYRPRPI